MKDLEGQINYWNRIQNFQFKLCTDFKSLSRYPTGKILTVLDM
jgi:hypothetical protein